MNKMRGGRRSREVTPDPQRLSELESEDEGRSSMKTVGDFKPEEMTKQFANISE